MKALSAVPAPMIIKARREHAVRADRAARDEAGVDGGESQRDPVTVVVTRAREDHYALSGPLCTARPISSGGLECWLVYS
jgi:hypothetical protein